MELPKKIPVVYTVGELIRELEKLPKDLEIRHDFEDGVQLKVFNVKTDVHLRFDEVEQDYDDDDYAEEGDW